MVPSPDACILHCAGDDNPLQGHRRRIPLHPAIPTFIRVGSDTPEPASAWRWHRLPTRETLRLKAAATPAGCHGGGIGTEGLQTRLGANVPGLFPGRRPVRGGGFTLGEVAMAVIVLALALTTSLTAMQRAFLEFDTARNLEIAGNILQCEIEKERLFTWSRASDATYQPVIDSSFTRNPAIAGRFTLSRSLTTLAQRSGQMVQITLTVRWRSYDGRTISRSYATYYTEGGLYEYFYNNP
ncbi:MAG: hypothetical protein HYV75_10415 [Opitutae bacterium]|nr:hypothetical protein [Opitutae bacterium]